MQKKYNRFKKLTIYKRKEKDRRRKKKWGKKGNFTELQKPKVEAEVYNNRKYD